MKLKDRKVVENQTSYVQNVEIIESLQSESMEIGGKTYDFSWFDVIASSDAYNSRSFMMMPDVHSAIASQMSDGVQTYYGHQTYDRPLGMTRKARVYGKKVRGEMGIQENLEDVNSNDIIARINTGVLGEVSIGFTGGEMISDITGNQMKRWFFGYYDPITQHDLGQKIKVDGKEIIVTAKLHNKTKTFDLRELSVVNAAADPNAKVLEDLPQEFHQLELNDEFIETISELNGINFGVLCETLSFNPNDTRMRRAIVSGADLDKNKGDEPVSKPNNENILDQSAKDAMEEVNRLTAEVDRLTKELNNRPSQEDYDLLNNDLDRANAQLKELKEDSNKTTKELQELADIGKKALETARNTALRAYCSYHGIEEGSDEWNHEEDKLNKNMDMDSLRDTASHYRTLKNSKRVGGRTSEGEFTQSKNKKVPTFSGNGAVMG